MNGRSMRRSYTLIVLATLVASVAGADDIHAADVEAKPEEAVQQAAAAAEPTPTRPKAWDAGALKTAEELAAKVRATGTECNDYSVHPIAVYDADYQRRMPLAAAISSCETETEEDLTFEVFLDAEKKQAFVDAKQAMLCRKAANMKLRGFPGFPYIDGGAWIIEPDEKATAERLAPLLGGEAKVAGCASL